MRIQNLSVIICSLSLSKLLHLRTFILVKTFKMYFILSIFPFLKKSTPGTGRLKRNFVRLQTYNKEFNVREMRESKTGQDGHCLPRMVQGWDVNHPKAILIVVEMNKIIDLITGKSLHYSDSVSYFCKDKKKLHPQPS